MDYVQVPDIAIDLSQKLKESLDALVFQALEPFGITKENCKECKKRMVVWCDGQCQHYFVDGEYAFSLCYKIPIVVSDDPAVTCSIRILETMKGWKCDGNTTGV